MKKKMPCKWQRRCIAIRNLIDRVDERDSRDGASRPVFNTRADMTDEEMRQIYKWVCGGYVNTRGRDCDKSKGEADAE